MAGFRKFIVNIIYSYLIFLARIQYKKFKTKIIGVTGTAGKSTIVLSTDSILKSKYKVLSSYQKGMGLNSITGISFVVLGILPTGYTFFHWIKYLFLAPLKVLTNWTKYDYFVLEYGIDVKNEMDKLIKIAVPDIAIWINTGATHIGNFSDKAENLDEAIKIIAHEEAKLIKALKPGAKAIIRTDDKHIKDEIDSWKGEGVEKIFISENQVESNLENGSLKFTYKGSNENLTVEITKYALTLDHPYSFISALLATNLVGISFEEGIAVLENKLELPKGRNTIIEGKNNSVIIDSSYNSSPEALRSAVNLLSSYKSRPQIAILGDMRELGEVSKEAHESIADYIASKLPKNILIVTVGKLMQEYLCPRLQTHGFSNVQSFMKAGEAGRYVEEMLHQIEHSSSVILIKGSQNTIFTEIAAEILMLNPNDAEKLLTRRGKHWDKKRAAYK